MTITTAPGHDLDPTSPTLVYDVYGTVVETPMLPMGGDVYTAVFETLPCRGLVQFHVRATTLAGLTIRSPLAAPCDTYVAVAADASTIVLQDDLSQGTGWIVGAQGDSASEGVWTLVDPIGTGSQPEVDHTSDNIDTCFVTGQGQLFATIGDNDVDFGKTSLVSPALDLSGSSQATIAYWRWYHNSFSQIDSDEGNGPNEEELLVFISDDDGAGWTFVESVGPAGPETAGGWFLHAFDAGSIVSLTSAVRLKFVATDIGNFSIVEAAIDDLVVYEVSCVDPKRPPEVLLRGQAPPLKPPPPVQ